MRFNEDFDSRSAYNAEHWRRLVARDALRRIRRLAKGGSDWRSMQIEILARIALYRIGYDE